MNKTIPIVAIGALLAAEAVAFVYAIVPDVSPTYRSVLIDRSSSCIPAAPSGQFPPGEAIPLVRSASRAPFDAIRVCGFADPSADGTATIGPEARLRFRHDVPLTLTIEARALADTPRIVHFGAHRIEVAPEVSSISLAIPAPADGVTDLELRTEPPPGAVGAGWRGILVHSLRLDPAKQIERSPASGGTAL